MTYEYLIFDLDDTLLDFTGGEVAAIRQLFSNELGLTDTDLDHALKTYQEINHHLWQQYELKKIARQQIFEERFKKTLAALAIDYDADHLEQEYATLRDHNYRLVPYATKFCNTCKNNIRLSPVQMARMPHNVFVSKKPA